MIHGYYSDSKDRRSVDQGFDRYLLTGTILLLGIGIVLVYSASSAVAFKRFGSQTYFFNRQMIHVSIAVLIMICCRYIPYTVYRYAAYPLLVAAFFLLIALYFPDIGHTVGGATRWVKPFGISFQPSEFAKLALIIYLAYSLSKKRDKIKDFSIGFLPHAIVLGCFTLLILFQPDFGMVVMMGTIAWIMLFVGGVRVTYLIGTIIALSPLAYYVLIHEGYRLRRLTSFMDPWQHQSDAGYQIVHSLMAFGSGGILGAGIGNSYQKLFYLPEPHTDFIFSVIGEELGLVGVCLVVSLYCVIFIRGIFIALRTHDQFGSFLATGITAAFGCQVIVNAGVALGLMPTKGLTLPFMSYGGTSMVINATAIGILMNISARRLKTPKAGYQFRRVSRKKRAPLRK